MNTSSCFTSGALICAALLVLPAFSAQADKFSAKDTDTVKGYMVANYSIHNPQLFKQYMNAAVPLAPQFDVKVIVYDEHPQVLEGKPEAIVAIAEFPSVAKTELFYNSKQYTSARKLRIDSTTGSVTLAAGLPTPKPAELTQAKGYLIANYSIHNQALYQQYADKAGPIVSKYNGQVIMYDLKSTALEGSPAVVMAAAEFPSVEDAKRFYHSAEYTAVRQDRMKSTTGYVVVAQGLPATDTATQQMNEKEIKGFIDDTVELMALSHRSPVLRTPDEYGMQYEDVFFPATDGVTIEGWFIPADSDRLIIMNHPMPANRYGYPGHLEGWKDFGGFEVNFLPEYKVLHDAGYNILTYDMRNHGRSGAGNGGIVGHGIFEYRDVIGSLRYAKSRADTRDMQVALYSRCLGANSTFVAMKKHPEEFAEIKAMIALQPVTPKVFIETAVENMKINNGMAMFTQAYRNRTGLDLDKVWPMEDAKAVTVPTLVAQVKDDFLTKVSNVQEIFDTIAAKDKKLFWIEGTDQRFEGYNYFGKQPEQVLNWLDAHMK